MKPMDNSAIEDMFASLGPVTIKKMFGGTPPAEQKLHTAASRQDINGHAASGGQRQASKR